MNAKNGGIIESYFLVRVKSGRLVGDIFEDAKAAAARHFKKVAEDIENCTFESFKAQHLPNDWGRGTRV